MPFWKKIPSDVAQGAQLDVVADKGAIRFICFEWGGIDHQILCFGVRVGKMWGKFPQKGIDWEFFP